jgi:hypothetical protein
MTSAVLVPAVIAEFDALLHALDVCSCTRPEWDRFKTIIAIATLEASNCDSGAVGYHKALARWRASRHYDGRD